MYVYMYLCIPFIPPMLMNTHMNNVIKNTSASSLGKHQMADDPGAVGGPGSPGLGSHGDFCGGFSGKLRD